MAEPRTCRGCGCTEDDPCELGCSWVTEDVCSACVLAAHLGRLFATFADAEGVDMKGVAQNFLQSLDVDEHAAAHRLINGTPPAQQVPLLYGAGGEVLATTSRRPA